MPSWFERSNTLKRIRDFFGTKGITAYLVGGYLRDRLLERESHDLDVAVAQEAIPLARELADILGGAFFALDPERDVGRIVLAAQGSKYLIDISRLRGKIEEDLARRDFTIDALAQNLAEPDSPLIDPHGGQKDLGAGLVRIISPQAFAEDPLRLLRAVRIAALLSFKIEPETRERIVASSHLITSVAVERVRDELAHLLLLPYSAPHLRLLHRTGVLSAALPDMLPALDLIGHSLGTLEALEIALTQEESPWPEVAEYLNQEIAGGRPRSIILKTVALLHHAAQDYSEHPPEGASEVKVLQEALTHLAFSSVEVRAGTKILRSLPAAWEIFVEENPRPLTLYRFFRDQEPMGQESILLALADQAASVLPGKLRDQGWLELRKKAGALLEIVYSQPHIVSPTPLLNGHELIQALKLSPGPEIGQLLEKIREAQVEGKVQDKAQALELARSLTRG